MMKHTALHSFVPPAVQSGRVVAAEVERLADFLSQPGKVCVLSGAGLSTESGIPDYRSPNGSYSKGHKPLTHQEFVKSETLRKRYWTRAVVGQAFFAQVQPNAGHAALTRLERAGVVGDIVTQNVDRLHQRAGSRRVLELHGHTDGVKCLSCSAEFSRREFQDKVARRNRAWFNEYFPPGQEVDVRADGDAHLETGDYGDVVVPGCSLCGGVLMPTIVFFGGSVPQKVRDQSFQAVDKANKVLVVGSSLTVWSSFRICKAANEQGKPIGILTAGETRADPLCAFKLDQSSCGLLLDEVANRMGV